MTKTQTIALSLFGVFMVLAVLFDRNNNQTSHMHGYVSEIESYLHPLEKEVEGHFSHKEDLYQMVFRPTQLSEEAQKSVLEELGKLSAKPYGLYVYQRDSMVFWSRTNVLPGDPNSLQKKLVKGSDSLLKLSNGYYQFKTSEEDAYGRKMVALIPIKNEFRLESDYLENWFAASDYIPYQVLISAADSDYNINSLDGKYLFTLSANESFKDAPQQKMILMFFLLAAIALCVFINSCARLIVQRYRPYWGAAFLIGSVVICRLLLTFFNFSTKFNNLEIFAKTFETPVLSYNLGTLLIDILLLLWMMVFFHREFKVKEMVHIARTPQFLLTTLNYFSIILGIVMVTSVFKSLVIDSGITFDFDNIFQLSIYSVLAILGIIFLLFALFLFCHRMMLTIKKTGLEYRLRVVAHLAALAAAIPIMIATDLDINVIFLAIGASLFVFAFDLYIKVENPTVIWLGIWLLIFSSSSAVLLYKYNEDKDLIRRFSYAKKLSFWQDSSAIDGLELYMDSLTKDVAFNDILFRENQPDTLRENQIQQRMEEIYSEFEYLFNIYSFTYTFHENENVAPLRANLQPTYEKRVLKVDEPKQMYNYIGNLTLNNPKNKGESLSLDIEAKKRLRRESMVYTELILNQNFKDLDFLDFYDYAVYRDSNLVESSGSFYASRADDFHNILALEKADSLVLEPEDKDFTEVVYQSDDERSLVVLRRQTPDLFRSISLFSYLFVLLGLTILFLALINTFTKMLPEVLQLTIYQRPTLRSKIQMAVILTILGSFIAIGFVTVVYFRDTSDDYHENRLRRKLGSVVLDAKREIEIEVKNGGDPEKIDWDKLVRAVSPIHRMDINVFDLEGNLITSTETDIFKKGIIAPKMGGVSYHALVRQQRGENIQSEKIGDLEYKAAYVPLKEPDGKILAFLGLPYYAKQRKLKDGVYEFMGTLLNVYVLLLLAAAAIAILVANSITRPIAVIGDRFRRFKLGSPEPLIWEGKGELGDLIDDYNRMLEKVAASTEIIKKSEREGAWRTMAQQVAHEIKNPLTPMKLSIQYLQHASKVNPDPERVQPLIERVGTTLTEQIENLAEIATAFSNFAKMPVPENTQLQLNELVESVYLLNVENQDVDFSLFLPDDVLTAFADKNQIRRVLNNVVSNAVQAIPTDRRGKVDISLFEKDTMAVIKVSDNGKGISEEMQDKVFQPHFTTRSSGMGLGLAMCKDMIEMANGRLYFNTVVGKGTDFFIELPKMKIRKEAQPEQVNENAE